MKAKITVLISVIIILLGLCSVVYGSNLSDLKDKKDTLKEELNNSNEKYENINIELTDVLEQIYDLELEITSYEEQISGLDDELQELEVEVGKTAKKLNEIQKNYDNQKKTLETRLVALYEAGEIQYLDFLLSSSSLSEFISNYFLISEITEYDNNLLEDIEDQKNTISSYKETLDEKQESLKIVKKEKERTSIALSNAKLVKDKYATQLSEDEAKLKQEIDELEKELAKVENEMSSIASGNLNPDYVGGDFAWPLPSSTTVTSPFGMRYHPVLKINRMHTGVDIGAPKGRDIVAANDGKIIKAGYTGSYGNLVMIDHGGGYVTAYGHGSEILVEVGQMVKRGDVIMLVGSTGMSTGPHLHFEVRKNGNCVDPMPFITSNKSNIEE